MAKDEARKAAHKKTICETLRRIIDECQGDSKKEEKVRKYAKECILMGKKMNARLMFYADHFHNGVKWDDDMWKKNRSVYEKRKLREGNEYKVD